MTTTVKTTHNIQATSRISHLDSLRAVAIIMVVAVHTLSYCLPLPPLQLQVISFIVQAAAVPIFFLVDGYLFARSCTNLKDFSYQRYITKSFTRLVVPWLIFTAAYTILRYIFEYHGFLDNKLIIGKNLKDITIYAYGSVYSSQMYFLLSLFIIRLFSPFIRIIFINKSTIITLLLFILYFIVYTTIFPTIKSYLYITNGQEPITHALWGLQFYIAGILIYKASLNMDVKKLFKPLLILLVTVLLFKNLDIKVDIALIQYIYLLTIFFLFTNIKKHNRVLDLIGRHTMGIYLIHVPIVLKAVSSVSNKIVQTPIVSFTLILILTVILSIIIVLLINSVPYGSTIFGVPYKKQDKI